MHVCSCMSLWPGSSKTSTCGTSTRGSCHTSATRLRPTTSTHSRKFGRKRWPRFSIWGKKKKGLLSVGRDFQLSLEGTVISKCLSVLSVGQAPGSFSNTSLTPRPLSSPQLQRTEGFTWISRSLAESPWLQHLMCSSYVIDFNKCFVYLPYLSCSCTLWA